MTLNDLYDIVDELIESDYLPHYEDMEQEGSDVLRLDYNRGFSLWLYTTGGTAGAITNYKIREFLIKKGFKL